MDPQTHVLTEFEQTTSVYASFKQRALALFLDGLILSPLAVIDWLNRTEWKSVILLFIVFAAGVLYKPFLEFKKGATIGKQALNISVISSAGTPVTIQQAALRNIFEITMRVLTFAVTLMVFVSAGFSSVTTNAEYVALQNNIANMNPYLVVYFLLILAEIILVLSDTKRRALHDRIGDTLVVKAGIPIPEVNGEW